MDSPRGFFNQDSNANVRGLLGDISGIYQTLLACNALQLEIKARIRNFHLLEIGRAHELLHSNATDARGAALRRVFGYFLGTVVYLNQVVDYNSRTAGPGSPEHTDAQGFYQRAQALQERIESSVIGRDVECIIWVTALSDEQSLEPDDRVVPASPMK
ncbi:MAG: hypothetical protein COV52_07690 [Gammaproteobacteria bacterium CG11_big_fil_rev_8_21_14_0_20_46_22]|nr:MAG: hypothetical protein COW05_03770 [Gammaproteobacteria bacterium CG12_big_fil_rev_8_21_14_0_65_46_12]PIR10639.1 MAG: hypothetical protein COV52_07690 [Gammaproteobacteria bacterium CG11_big_fil_rev_8_21_14_0_20_46_22]